MNKEKKQKQLNSLNGSLKYLDGQITSTRTMIRQLERTIKNYERSKSNILRQVEDLKNEPND
tara:strand:+ start:3484 stop:3669 length:186 start_codon:yes stop_codon:yes gene_type:complete